jgi:hypothetical protein
MDEFKNSLVEYATRGFGDRVEWSWFDELVPPYYDMHDVCEIIKTWSDTRLLSSGGFL